jgi:carbonic anhydrase/acetyltransferase-like protein (isoleucine patch superfamily)
MSYGSKRVALAEDIFVAPSATVLGDVKIGKGSSVWYGAVLRGALCGSQALLRVVGSFLHTAEEEFCSVMGSGGHATGSDNASPHFLRTHPQPAFPRPIGDVNSIIVGEKTNIQDNVIVHVARHNPQQRPAPTIIGNFVTIGHGATIHAATIEDGALVGMGAIVMDGATVRLCS